MKFRLKLKKVGKITRPFRYDLNQIPYDYVRTNRFKGLDLLRVPEEQWTEVHNIAQDVMTKTIPKKKKGKKANWFSKEALRKLRKEEKPRGKGKI